MVQVVSMLDVPAHRDQEVSNKPDVHNLLPVWARGGFLTQEVGVHLVPVEGGEWGAEVRVLVVVQQTFETRLCVTDLRGDAEDEADLHT